MMRRVLLTWAVLGMLCFASCSSKQPSTGGAKEPAESITKKTDAAAEPSQFQDDQTAHAIYNQMIEAMRKADSLSYVSHFEMEGKDFKTGSTYRAWLKKPNYFRVEAESDPVGRGGTLIGDGSTLWIYWLKERPHFVSEEVEPEADKKTYSTSYMKKNAPLAKHSIGHEVCYLGAGLSMPVIDPSTFHGYTDSLQKYLDGVKSMGTEKVGDEDCDVIEVSIMKHQRSWYLYLSKADHLPRKMKEIVRVSYDLVVTEDWSSVTVNADIPDTLFAWKPPEGWSQWEMPPIEIGLLKPGTKAPDFELASADGNKIKLSDMRGQIVWLYVWRAG
jgi:outer membrane lipoprotein-sorting protein